MTASNLLRLALLIVVAYLALRVGAFVLRGALGLVAIGLVVWVVASLFRGGSRR